MAIGDMYSFRGKIRAIVDSTESERLNLSTQSAPIQSSAEQAFAPESTLLSVEFKARSIDLSFVADVFGKREKEALPSESVVPPIMVDVLTNVHSQSRDSLLVRLTSTELLTISGLEFDSG